MVLFNFPNGLDGIVLCDVPGAATITSDQDEDMMKKCLQAPGVSILLSKISNKNSAIFKLANREPNHKSNCWVLCFSFCDMGSNKTSKTTYLPNLLQKMKKMVNAKYTIQTSKDDMKSLYDLIRRFQQLQAKKMYWIYNIP